MGPLVKLASLIMPASGRIYNDSVEFGKQFPRHNAEGPGDAARHAYASARMAKEYGPMIAKLMGGLHEVTTLGQDRRSEAMDEYNNRVGYGLADLDEESLREAILGLLNEGGLKTLPKEVQVQGYRKGGLIQMKEKQSCR